MKFPNLVKTTFVLLQVLLLNEGCISNPYNDPRQVAEKEARKYPHHAEHIRQQQKDWEARRSSEPDPSNVYFITPKEISNYGIGDPNTLIRFEQSVYKYHHWIYLTLVCEKDIFIPKPYGRKDIKWKLTDSLQGEAQTAPDGKMSILVITDDDKRFYKLTLLTSKRSYEVKLTNFLTPELEKDECM